MVMPYEVSITGGGESYSVSDRRLGGNKVILTGLASNKKEILDFVEAANRHVHEGETPVVRLEREIRILDQKLNSLGIMRHDLIEERRLLLAAEWVRVNGATQMNTLRSSKYPNALVIQALKFQFDRDGRTEKFIEWNGMIYHVDDAFNCRWANASGAKWSDLPEE